MMKTNRREFIGYTAAATAVVSTGVGFASTAHANQAELDALKNYKFATSMMPSMFAPYVDMTGFENY